MSTNKVVEDKKEKPVLENTNNGSVNTMQNLDPKKIIQDLLIQEKHHGEEEERHRIIKLKARGALEVLLQMHPQEETKQ